MITEVVVVPPPIPMTKSWLQGVEDAIKERQKSEKIDKDKKK